MLANDSAAPLLIGVDLGKVTTSLAWGRPTGDGAVDIAGTRALRHHGDPLAPFFAFYRELGPERVAAVAATGVFSDRLGAPVVAGIPEEIAQQEAVTGLRPDGALTVVRIGGGGYSVLARDAAGRFTYEPNERCSAGTGQTVEGLCSRLGRTLDEAVALAEAAGDSLTVTSRCAVFAKSELTHYANQGASHERLFRGVFEGIARNVHALYDRTRPGAAGAASPVLLVGHGATIAPIAREFARLAGAGVRVEVAEHAGAFEAIGALRYAAHAEPASSAVWPARPEDLARAGDGRLRTLPPAAAGPGSVVRLEAPPLVTSAGGPAVLGLDLGSTGSKAALLDVASGAVLADVYRRTDGNPVEAAQRLVAAVLEASAAPVVGVGLTGSGRDAAAAVFRAAYPDAGPRLTVLNEIVAHATAAVRDDPDGGRSLSIVEIGGQDAKFVNVREGRVVDSDMNRVCSAGTGSFLEEQAEAFGLDDITLLGDLAARSPGAPDLGQTCTVFVADVAAEALAQGFTREDIFAGLQYSVVRNYCGRVKGDRPLLETVFFQGKPATSRSLARTLAAVTGRTVVVPADPGAMGAIGVALLAAERLGAATRQALDLGVVLDAAVVERHERRCGEPSCGNLCRLEVAEVEVAGERRRVVSGGSCPKYDQLGAVGEKLAKDAPRPFRERRELLARLSEDVAPDPAGQLAGVRVGLPAAHYLLDLAPFFAAFFAALGAAPVLITARPETLAAGDRACAAPGVCAPAKLLHGLAAAADVDVLFAPKIINLRPPNGGTGTSTCPVAQGAPDMVADALAAAGSPVRVLRPALCRHEETTLDSSAFWRELVAMVRSLEPATESTTGPAAAGGLQIIRAVRRAWHAGLAHQARFEEGLAAIGRRAVDHAAAAGRPVVVVCGETHVIHEPLLDCGVGEIAAANGALAVPVDCYPVPAAVPGLARVHWASAGQTLRAATAGRAAGDAFPLLVGAYGCGPNSFVEHLFNDLGEGRPYALLESDGHGGAAGYVTRIQAFLHAVEQARGSAPARGDAPPAGIDLPARLARYDVPLPTTLDGDPQRTIVFGHIGGTVGRQIAAALRGQGYRAEYAGPTDAAALECGRRLCSGKECLPYQLIWGTLARYLETRSGDGDGRLLFLSVGQGFRACRAHLFPLTEQVALERLGHDGVDIADLSLVFGDLTVVPTVWASVVAQDLLNALRFEAYSSERTRGDADALFEQWSDVLAGELARERPRGNTATDARSARETLTRVRGVLGGAAAAYAALPRDRRRAAELRTVHLCGDLYLRVDEWGNDDLQRRLSEHGLRVLFEPYGAFFELLALRDMQVAHRLSRRAVKRRATLVVMRAVVDRLLGAVQPLHPWLDWPDIHEVVRESDRVFDGYPMGETVSTVGGALHAWRARPVDGVVVVSPRGCGPALLAEALLRRRPGPPLLFVYNDGDPVDADRLRGFAWRLHAATARR
ncbi:MAG TPA: BadF/BadG/BcrA/BcrD ATPase family protein [Thermoleophilia bacterium]|nr:BadF/BadG/BcrA/BcrD ATPase family protein [Thermoleophilia bacterium]